MGFTESYKLLERNFEEPGLAVPATLGDVFIPNPEMTEEMLGDLNLQIGTKIEKKVKVTSTAELPNGVHSESSAALVARIVRLDPFLFPKITLSSGKSLEKSDFSISEHDIGPEMVARQKITWKEECTDTETPSYEGELRVFTTLSRLLLKEIDEAGDEERGLMYTRISNAAAVNPEEDVPSIFDREINAIGSIASNYTMGLGHLGGSGGAVGMDIYVTQSADMFAEHVRWLCARPRPPVPSTFSNFR